MDIFEIALYTSIGFNLILFIQFSLVWKYSRDVTWTFIKAGIKKVYAITIRWTVDKKFMFDIPDIDPQASDTWNLKIGGEESPKHILKGTVGVGPDRMDMVIVTDEGLDSIDLDKEGDDALFATSGYIKKIKDLAHADGYMEGFNDSEGRGGLWDKFVANPIPVITLILIFIIGAAVLNDRIWAAPGAWAQTQKCEQEKSVLIGRCSQYIDYSKLTKDVGIPTTTVPASNTGSKITSK